MKPKTPDNHPDLFRSQYKDEDKYGRISQTLKLRLYPRNKDISQLPV